MSSVSCSISRKRNHSASFRDSSDSEDEAPPLKLKRRTIGSKIPVTISSRLRNFVLWISDLSVKGYFKMAIKAGSTLPEETIVIDDDDDDDNDDDVQVVHVKEVEKPRDRVNPFIQRLKQPRRFMPIDNSHPRRQINNCVSSSTRSRSLSNGSSYLSPTKFSNGTSFRNWCSRINENGSYNLRQYRTNNLKRPAVVSNPETDVEILLEKDPIETLSTEADEIEILSESPNMKKKAVNDIQHQIRSSRSVAKKSISSQGASQTQKSMSQIQKPVLQTQKPVTSKSQSSSNGSFTAHEVFRLHERIQYQLLLEKYISGAHYHQPASPPHVDVEIQADDDEEEEEEDLEFPGSHFKKEVLHQPVENFIEKYCKPCRLVSPITYQSAKDKKSDSSEKKNEPVEVKIDDDDDDEIQILDVKLPEYKPKYREKPDFFSSNWISELKRTVNAQLEERLIIVREQERMLERVRKERLLDLLKVDATIPESKEPEFPELTPEMEDTVDKAWHTGAPDDVLCKVTSDNVTRKDIETLSGLNWLNDLIINSYFDLIVMRSKQEGYPSIHAYNTFFYSTYKTKGYQSVRRWTRRIDIFSFDLNFVPIHLGVHWCLAVIDHRSKQICYYDSMGRGEEHCLNLLHEYLILEYKDKKGLILDPTTYTTEVMKDIPQQMNGSDCGMFTLKYAEYISRDAEITFSQKHMQYFRRRMVYEILTCQLL